MICGRLLGFDGPLAFWGAVGVVVGAASAAFANVLVKARSMQLAARNAGGVANDFRNCAVVTAWVCRRWKPGAFSLDSKLGVLPALSGCDGLGPDVSASLLAAATPDGRAAAKYLAHHSTRSSHARLALRRRNISALILVRHCAGPCGSVDDFPKTARAGAADSRRVDNYHDWVYLLMFMFERERFLPRLRSPAKARPMRTWRYRKLIPLFLSVTRSRLCRQPQ